MALITTDPQDRTLSFLRKAELDVPPAVTNLARLSQTGFAQTEDDLAVARSLLVEQRTTEPGYRQPEQKKRYFLKNDEWKKEKGDFNTWTFTKHEVAKAFSALLGHTPLASVSVAQALLSYVAPITIDELWCHLYDKKLEKKMSRRFFARRSSSEFIPDLTWLDWATENDHLDYVRLLCRKGIPQEELNRAFGLALTKDSMQAMTILLRSGAVAASYKNVIKEHIKLKDVELVRLLLSAPHAMTAEVWRECLEPDLQMNPPSLLLQCLAHRPEIVSTPLLLKSLMVRNLSSTAVILAYMESYKTLHEFRESACEIISRIEDDEMRLKIFDLFTTTGLLTNIPLLRKELMKDVKTRQIELVQLLVDAQVGVDVEPDNAAAYAVSNLDLEVLEIFKSGVFASPVSPLLDLVPQTASESSMLHIIEVLEKEGLAGEPLHQQLIYAIQKMHLVVAKKLLVHGASIEFQNASAVQAALKNTDFHLLGILFTYECSPDILSAAVPVAMNMTPRSARLRAMQCLAQKGVLPVALSVPLQTLASEKGDVDYELIRLVLQHKAPLDDVGVDEKNAVLVATKRGLVPLLKLLCAEGPKKTTLSNALPIAFDALHTHTYDTAYEMLEVLLKSGATGDLAHQTLLDAATQDDKLRIVQLLLDAGADANYKSGAAFATAIRSLNFALLQRLCVGCPPTPANTKGLLIHATASHYFDAQALDLLLSMTPDVATVLNTPWSSEHHFKDNPNICQIIQSFLSHGMDVDVGHGFLLCFAILERNLELLSIVLSASPTVPSLTKAFEESTNILERSIKDTFMRLLLGAAISVEIGQSAELPRETMHALRDDSAIFETLLEHGADVNFAEGLSLALAAAAGSKKTLAALLSRRPAPRSIQNGCLATASSTAINVDEKYIILKRLLDTNGGMTVENMMKILVESVKVLPTYTQLPELLLVRGAVADLAILQIALLTSSQTLFTLLTNSVLSPDTLLKLFRFARDQDLTPERRYWIYKYLLGRGIAKDDISEALLKILTSEGTGALSLCSLLLEYGAFVGYKTGAILTSAFNLNSFVLVDLLSKHFIDDRVANVAFDLASENELLDKDTRYAVYQCILAWSINIQSIERALVQNLAADLLDADIVNLLLECGANPNKEHARCFAVAAQRGAEDEFRTLSRYGNPDLELVLESLLKNFKEEWEVVRWFGTCLEEHLSPTRVCRDELLFRCMRTFPNGTRLLKLLLDKGVSASAKINIRLCPGWQAELCTVLIWAIRSTTPRIGNDAILALIERGANQVQLTFATPLSGLTAGFACVIDGTRTDVLQAMINLDVEGLTGQSHTMLESKFTHLAAYPEALKPDQNNQDATQEIDLRTASAYTGNFQAFKLMRFKNEPNDGMLIVAVILALPKFIKWLLATGHDPNFRSGETGMLIPLAMLCSSKYMASCKVANMESNFAARQKQSMKLLAPVTDLKWTYRLKTVLHYAFDNGAEVTKAMIEALNISGDSEKDERYLYTDKEGLYYSPDQYLSKLMTDLKASERNKLISMVQQCGMKSRYYRDIEPGHEKKQPDGYVGLPKRLQLMWATSGNTDDEDEDEDEEDEDDEDEEDEGEEDEDEEDDGS